MKKFPVTSSNGNKYLVKIISFSNRKWICKVYKPIYLKGYKIWSKLVDTGVYGESFENDFILITERAINDYEEKIQVDDALKENKKKFKNWDGKL